MKINSILFVTSLILLSACGAYKEEGTQGGDLTRFAPEPLEVSDKMRVETVCQALSQKAARLSDMVADEFSFSFSETQCEGGTLDLPQEIQVAIDYTGSNYIFKNTSGGTFAFPNVETHDSGVMKEICSQTGTLKSPVRTSNTTAIWFSSYGKQSDCMPASDEICIFITKQTLVAEDSFTPKSKEWIKFKSGDFRKGFFVDRAVTIFDKCANGAHTTKRVTLR